MGDFLGPHRSTERDDSLTLEGDFAFIRGPRASEQPRQVALPVPLHPGDRVNLAGGDAEGIYARDLVESGQWVLTDSLRAISGRGPQHGIQRPGEHRPPSRGPNHREEAAAGSWLSNTVTPARRMVTASQ